MDHQRRRSTYSPWLRRRVPRRRRGRRRFMKIARHENVGIGIELGRKRGIRVRTQPCRSSTGRCSRTSRRWWARRQRSTCRCPTAAEPGGAWGPERTGDGLFRQCIRSDDAHRDGIWQGRGNRLTPGAVVMYVVAVLQQGGNLVGGQTTALSGVVSAPAPAATTPTVTAQG